MRYSEAVAEAKRLVKRSEEDQWRLAELTWQAVHEHGKTQREWATDIGRSAATVNIWAKIWDVYRVNTERPPFADAYAEAKGLPVDRTERRHAEARANLRRATPEQQAEVVNELLRNPEVAERAVNIADREVEQNLARARVQRSEREYERAQRNRGEDRELARIERTERWASVLHDLAKMNVLGGEVVTAISKLGVDTAHRDEIESYLTRIGHKLDWVRAQLDGSASNLDDELANLLGGDAR